MEGKCLPSAVYRKRYILEAISTRITIYDTDVYYNFLMVLTDTLKMHALTPPIVKKVPVKDESILPSGAVNFGVSGVILWLESGVQIHTWPEYLFISLDIYSCKNFKTDDVDKLFNLYFSPTIIITRETI